MAPKVNVLGSAIHILKLTGIVDPSSETSHRLFLAWNCILVLGGIEFVTDVFLGTVLARNKMNMMLENLTLVISGLSFSFTHFLFSWRKKEIFTLIHRVNRLLEEVEGDLGERRTGRWDRICKIIYFIYSFGVLGQITVYYVFTLIKYCFLGVKDASPFEIYFPFEKEGRFIQVLVFQLVTFIHPIMSVILGKTVFGSFTVVIRGILEATERRFRRIEPENPGKYLEQTIRWHAEAIQIVQQYNSLFRIVFVMEYLLSMIYISTSGFLMIRVQSFDDTECYRYIGMYVSYLSHPLFTCICGHLIWNQNEKLYASIYDNDWYRLTPRERNHMLLPTLLSGKRLTVNYRGHVHFNLSLYLHIFVIWGTFDFSDAGTVRLKAGVENCAVHRIEGSTCGGWFNQKGWARYTFEFSTDSTEGMRTVLLNEPSVTWRPLRSSEPHSCPHDDIVRQSYSFLTFIRMMNSAG